MKSLRDLIALNRFETMRERHRRWWDLNHGSIAMTRDEFVAGIIDRIREAHPDRFEPRAFDQKKAH